MNPKTQTVIHCLYRLCLSAWHSIMLSLCMAFMQQIWNTSFHIRSAHIEAERSPCPVCLLPLSFSVGAWQCCLHFNLRAYFFNSKMFVCLFSWYFDHSFLSPPTPGLFGMDFLFVSSCFVFFLLLYSPVPVGRKYPPENWKQLLWDPVIIAHGIYLHAEVKERKPHEVFKGNLGCGADVSVLCSLRFAATTVEADLFPSSGLFFLKEHFISTSRSENMNSEFCKWAMIMLHPTEIINPPQYIIKLFSEVKGEK